jgi:hypothetical protein
VTGVQPPSFTVSGAIVTDCTQSTPPSQSLPAGMAPLKSQAPVHPGAGSNDVCGVMASSCAHVAALAVTVAGSSHEPVGGSQLQAPHVAAGAVRSAWPSYTTMGATSGHEGTPNSGPNASNIGSIQNPTRGKHCPSQLGYGPSALASPPSLLAKNIWQ